MDEIKNMNSIFNKAFGRNKRHTNVVSENYACNLYSEKTKQIQHESEELKPCPFCNSKAVLVNGAENLWFVNCTGCSVAVCCSEAKVIGELSSEENKRCAIDKWNKRTCGKCGPFRVYYSRGIKVCHRCGTERKIVWSKN